LPRRRLTASPLPPCVYFKHGAYWLVKKGKWTRLGVSLAESLEAYARIVETRKGSMPELIEKVYAYHCRDKAKSTADQYRHAADRLKEIFKSADPGQVKSKHVAAVKTSLASTPNMANRITSFLRTVFTYAVEWQIVDSNPCIGVRRHAERKRTRLIDDAEWRSIYAQAGPRLRVVMDLQYLTGQRINDVLKIRRSQITDEGISFEQQKTGEKLVIRWSRHLRATVAAAEALSAGKPPALTLLRGRYNGAPDYRSVLLQWNEACKAAGVEDARLNDGRAKSATAANSQGLSAQALLGHTTPQHTDRYIRERAGHEARGPKMRGSAKRF
jgi:integrase